MYSGLIGPKYKSEKKTLLQTSGLALGSVLIDKSVLALDSEIRGDILSYPDKVTALLNGNEVTLLKSGTGKWRTEKIAVSLINTKNSIEVFVDAPQTTLDQIILAWNTGSKLSSTILNDHWERTFGDISWHKPVTSEIFPWYFVALSPVI